MEEGIHPVPEETVLEPQWTLSLAESPSLRSNGAERRGGPEDHMDGMNPEVHTQPAHLLNGMDSSLNPANQRMLVTLDDNRRLTHPLHWQDVRHLVFTGHSSASYTAGDVLKIYPKNNTEDVNQFLERMAWTGVADKPIHFAQTKPLVQGHAYPPPPIRLYERTTTTLRSLLTENLDLTAIPKRSFFSLIAHFTNNQFHKDRLLEFTKPEYLDELYDYTTRPRRSILEVLQEFESVQIPWQWAATVLPELRGRQFSIASGGQLKTNSTRSARFELLVAIVKYKTVIKKIREGVCTRYLAYLPVGTQLKVDLLKGGLAITKAEARRPVIMIGPGTGVAPMRSLIYERLQWFEEVRSESEGLSTGQANGISEIGKNMLFFGCRSYNADYFYQNEWKDLMTRFLLRVHTAFSRDQNRKIYVQDLIIKEGDEVYRLLHEENGIVYVCGSSGNMPKAVRAALVDVFKSCGSNDSEAAEMYLEKMEKEGRYKQETW